MLILFDGEEMREKPCEVNHECRSKILQPIDNKHNMSHTIYFTQNLIAMKFE